MGIGTHARHSDVESISRDWSREQCEAYIASLPIWSAPVKPMLEWLVGGLINRNWIVHDGASKYVARVFFDAGVQGISEQSVLASTRAAAEIGVTPKVRYSEPHLTVVDFIDGRNLTEQELTDKTIVGRCMEKLGILHAGTTAIRSPINYHWRPLVIRNLIRWNVENNSPHASAVTEVLPLVEKLERKIRPFTPCFTHNDLAHVNVMLDRNDEMWLIDWDFGAVGHPMSDISDFLSYGPPTHEIEHHAIKTYLGAQASSAEFERAMQDYRISLLLTYCFQFTWAGAVDHSTHKTAEDIRESMQTILPDQEASYRGFMNMARERLEASLVRFKNFLD
ncbi:phosphotransferase [Hyphomicrobium facile]|uniref:Thiamine kinase n=1 Tax=Hyphomicrobium facile TaxID=51670 RepID=A0A1I7NVJ1_9HYPH|nr:phosphotransferase [Hyphomicrobium facile]SFV38677.1 Thiamine kinase [Hyphomicrobium facile]